MAKNLYVRVKPKGPVSEFHRCGIKHTLLWVLHTGLDDATAERLENEQMLETSATEPEGFAEQGDAAGENAEQVNIGVVGSGLLPSIIQYAGGFEIALGDLVAGTLTESGLATIDWNGLPQPARELMLAGHLASLYKTYVEDNGLSLGLVEPAVEEFKAALEAKIAEVGTLTEKVTGLEAELSAANEYLAKARQQATEQAAVSKATKTKAK